MLQTEGEKTKNNNNNSASSGLMIASKRGGHGQFGDSEENCGTRVRRLHAQPFITETSQSSICAGHTDPDPLRPGAKAGGGRNPLVFRPCWESKGVKGVKV